MSLVAWNVAVSFSEWLGRWRGSAARVQAEYQLLETVVLSLISDVPGHLVPAVPRLVLFKAQ